MLLCFGLAWPVSLYKSWTSRRTAGKSLGFLIVVFLGYASGVVAKILRGPDPVLILYVLNGSMVLGDIVLYWRNTRYERGMARSIEGGAALPSRTHSK